MNDAAQIEAFWEANKGWTWREPTSRKIGGWCVTYTVVLDDGTQYKRIHKLAPSMEAAQWAAACLELDQSKDDRGWYSVGQLTWADHAD